MITSRFILHVTVAIIAFAAAVPRAGRCVELPEGYMTEAESQQILDKTLAIRLDPVLSGLSANEHLAVQKLIEVGKIFQRIYEDSRHYQAVAAYEELCRMDKRLGSPRATQNLIQLYYLFKGPVGRTLDNRRVAFLPVEPRVPGKNIYPWGVDKKEIDAFFEQFPAMRPWLLDVRSVVRKTEKPAVKADLARLDEYPVLDVLHTGLKEMLENLAEDSNDQAYYALPYSVAYAEPLMQAYKHLNDAADLVDEEDPDFAQYLRNRARDLLSDDYESGDASWVSGKFHNLNAQIGSYEVYDDQLYGVKSFFGFNVLIRDHNQSEALQEAIKGIQDFENSLPYEPDGYAGTGNKKNVREDIPVGVYNIVADFGQSRGTNTATILPNESAHARKYGRTILMRYNILNNPELFKIRLNTFRSAVVPEFVADLKPEGAFYRTLWHEMGHYLGPDRTRDGRELGEALEHSSNKLEELKSDLVSLYLVRALYKKGYYDKDQRKAVYASGIRRVLLKNKPRLSQTYQTMELMQMNYYLAKGLLEFDRGKNRMVIHYDHYHDVISLMLEEVLALQYDGDKAAADSFIQKYTSWDDDLHEVLAQSMKSTEKYRYAMVTYGALDQ